MRVNRLKLSRYLFITAVTLQCIFFFLFLFQVRPYIDFYLFYTPPIIALIAEIVLVITCINTPSYKINRIIVFSVSPLYLIALILFIVNGRPNLILIVGAIIVLFYYIGYLFEYIVDINGADFLKYELAKNHPIIERIMPIRIVKHIEEKLDGHTVEYYNVLDIYIKDSNLEAINNLAEYLFKKIRKNIITTDVCTVRMKHKEIKILTYDIWGLNSIEEKISESTVIRINKKGYEIIPSYEFEHRRALWNKIERK